MAGGELSTRRHHFLGKSGHRFQHELVIHDAALVITPPNGDGDGTRNKIPAPPVSSPQTNPVEIE